MTGLSMSSALSVEPVRLLEYLGRYTRKIAISHHRLQSIDDGMVSFSYKDYRDGSKTMVMTLSSTEFRRRFCLHILPKDFRKIRHHGILSSRNKAKLQPIRDAMNIPVHSEASKSCTKVKDMIDTRKQCPCCKKGRMEIVMTFGANAPPWLLPCYYLNPTSQPTNS